MSWEYSEDQLAQKPTVDYLENALKWKSVYAFNRETLGPDGLLGRSSERDVVLTRDLRQALVRLNPDLPDAAYDEAIRQITASSVSKSIIQANSGKYALHKKNAI